MRRIGTLGTALWAITILTHDPPVGDLRLGQRVFVDDGTCPQGQIKELIGAKLTASGVQRVAKCVARSSLK